MEDVIDDLRAFGWAEGVDAAHIAEYAPTDMVHVVEGELVSLGQAVAVSPAPAGGEARVVVVGDFVVGDGVVGAVSDPDADSTGEDPPAAADDVVVDGDVACVFRFVSGWARLADADAAGPEVVEVAAGERAVAAALTEPDGVDTGMAKLAILDDDVACPVGHDDGLDGRGGLRGFESARRRDPLAVAEREALDADVLDVLLGGRIALDEDKPFDDRGDDLGLGHVFAGQRAIVERAVAGEEPFAGCVEGAKEVFEVEAGVSFPRVPRLHASSAGDESLLLVVQRVDEAAGVVPLVVEHKVDVAKLLGRDLWRGPRSRWAA